MTQSATKPATQPANKPANKPADGKPEHGDAHSVHRRSDGGVWPDGTPRDPASGPPHYGDDKRDQKKPRDHGSDWATSDLVKDVPGKGPVPVGQDQDPSRK